MEMVGSVGAGGADAAIPRFAVIPTRGNRPDVLDQCLKAIRLQVNRAVIVFNGDEPPNRRQLGLEWTSPWVSWIWTPLQPPNLSALWNQGLAWAAGYHNSFYDVAVLNDDAIAPPGWFEAVSWDMRAFNASAGCSDPDGRLRAPIHHRKIGPVGLDRRLVGYAFILRGEHNIRANEDIHWYFSDDHIDYAARELGGVVMIPGFPVQHLHPNEQMSPELSARIAVDAQNFKDRWGIMPW